MKIETLLKEEITDEFENLKKMELGTEAYKTTVDGVTKLVDRSIKLKELENEQLEKEASREMEANLRQQEIDNNRRNEKIKNGIAIGSLIGSIGLTIWGTFKTFKFEEEGTITTIMGRGFISRLLGKK